MVIFTIAWITSAMTRLAEFRRGERPAIRIGHMDARACVTLLAGTAPWLLLGFLQSAYPTSPIWVPFKVPALLHALGIGLGLAAVLEPFSRALRKPSPAPDGAAGNQVSIAVLIRSGAILLLSGSVVFSLFCGLWLTVALWPAFKRFRLGISLSTPAMVVGQQPLHSTSRT